MNVDTINYLEKVELHAIKIIAEEFSEKLVFSDIEHTHRVVSGVKRISEAEGLNDLEKEVVLMSAWFTALGFKNLENWADMSKPKDLFSNCSNCSIMEAESFLKTLNYPHEKYDLIIATLKDAAPYKEPTTKLGKVLADAITIEWASKKGKKRLELRYQELLLLNLISSSKDGFYENILGYLNRHKYHTNYGQTVLEKKKQSLIEKVNKERKDLHKQEQTALKKELDISDEELKKLKKSLKAVRGRDERGIQTMFRTTSRNHYTLNQMVDRKANIMISVNAIILSLIISRIIGNMDTFCIHNAPILLLLISSVISIIFSVIAIIPIQSHGEFSEKEVRAKQGNLLYFGNYHNMSFRDYNWGMLQMLNDSDYLYTSMIKDQYFLGQQLSRKYTFIRKALFVFMLGLIGTVVFFLLVSSMSDFHIGGAH